MIVSYWTIRHKYKDDKGELKVSYQSYYCSELAIKNHVYSLKKHYQNKGFTAINLTYYKTEKFEGNIY